MLNRDRCPARPIPSRFLPMFVVLVLFFSAAYPAYGQSCSWGGTPILVPPSSRALRSVSELYHAPGRLAVDSWGNIYSADPGNGRVIVRDPYGRVISTKEGLGSPSAIAVDSFGNIYVAEQQTGGVTGFDPDWNPYMKLGQGDGEFLVPNDIAIDPDPRFHSIYVSDGGAHAIKVYSPNGVRQRTIGGPGRNAGQFNFPAAIYITPDGELFVGDQNNDRVQVLDRDGNFLRCFGKRGGMSFSQKFGRIQGLTGDDQGRIYVADSFQGQVRVFDTQGATLATIGSFGEGPGELRTPIGLVLDSFNRLFVASANNARVEVFGIDAFSDPHSLTALVDFHPDRVKIRRRRSRVTAYVEIPDASLNTVRPDSITANGVPVFIRKRRLRRAKRTGRSAFPVGDHDGDGIPDLKLRFNARAVMATLGDPDGDGDAAGLVMVAGELYDGTPFEGADTVRLVLSRRARRGRRR